MKKYFQYFIAFVLTITVVGVARNSPAWASPQSSENARPNAEIVITEEGEYAIGGICNFKVSYKVANLSNKAAVDVPAETSREVTFSYPDDLYLAGCHLTHMKDNQVKNEMSTDEGEWQVCFGDRPGEKLTIYYYSDEAAAAGNAAWLALPTTKTSDDFVCAPSMFTGVYAPGGQAPPQQSGAATGANQAATTFLAGTVIVTTSNSSLITESGKYGAGGICELFVEYFVPNLTNELHVEDNVEISAKVPFPDNQGLLYLPGCHVFHYKKNAVVDEVTTAEGKWEICFAAIPSKETTIYFYYADDDTHRVTSVWAPLETRVSDGKACAPKTNFTGVYAPVGK